MHIMVIFGYRPENLCSVAMAFPLSFRHLLLPLFKVEGGHEIKLFSAQQQTVLFSADDEPMVSAILKQ